jgi:hypothetical protein
MEAKLGITLNADLLKDLGYPDISYDYKLLNAELASIGSDAANSELSASSIHFLAQEFFKLVKICEEELPFPSVQLQEVGGVISRAELYLRHMKMSQEVLHSLTALLYNRINQRESQSMKTIAVATLLFLPATFVSTVFGSGIFDFHAYQGQNTTTVSKYWTIYLTICIVLTALTMTLWVVWYKWGNHWHSKRMSNSNYPSQKSWLVEEELLLRAEQSNLQAETRGAK